MWAFACIMAVELFVTHLLVSLWSGTAAWIFSAATVAMLAWIVLLIRSFSRLPVRVDKNGVLMRLGLLKALHVPASRIAGIRSHWPSGAHARRGVLNLAMINYPNVMLDLDPPLETRAGKRPIIAVALRLDDGPGFAAAVTRLMDSRA